MFVKIVIISIVYNVVFADTVEDELMAVFKSSDIPFSELPCMLIGGSCEKGDSCSKGLTRGSRGLCPVQQNDGVECCVPVVHTKRKS